MQILPFSIFLVFSVASQVQEVWVRLAVFAANVLGVDWGFFDNNNVFSVLMD